MAPDAQLSVEALRGMTLGSFLKNKAQRNQGKTCIEYLHDGRTWSYAQLDEAADRLAAGLQEIGIGKGVHVAMLSDNRPEQVIAYFALGKLGAVCIPVNTAAKGAFLSYILEQSDSTAILVEPEHLAPLAEVIGELPSVRTVIQLPSVVSAAPIAPPIETLGHARIVPFEALISNAAGPMVDAARPADLAQILYTSGTTGRSKGNMFGHTAMLNWARQVAAGHELNADDVYLVVFPLYHAGAWLSCVLATMWADGTIALGRGFSASHFLEHARGCRATVAFMVSVAGFLLTQPESAADRDHQLRKLVTAPPPPDPLAFESRFGLRLLAGFGLSDYGASHSRGMSSPRDKIGSSGVLNPGWEVQCADDEGAPLPVGAIGEILLRCNIPGGAVSGYYKMPNETLESRRNLWFCTGDLGYIDAEGYLYFVDRKKDSIRRRGENISSLELELTLCMHPAVGAAAFFPVSAEIGEDEVAVAVIARAGFELSEAEVVEYCQAKMPRYAVPRYVRLVHAFPTTANGKVQKSVLRRETEAELANVWDRERPR